MRSLQCALIPCVFTLCFAAVFNHPGRDGACPAGARCVALSQCSSIATAAGAASDALRPPSCASAAREHSVCCTEDALSSPNFRSRRSPADAAPYSASPSPRPTAAPQSKPSASTGNVTSVVPSSVHTTQFSNDTSESENDLSPSERACQEYRRYQERSGKWGSGRARIGIVRRAVGGERAGATEFPYMVAVGYVRGNGSSGTSEVVWGCGGSLISDRYVLTSAHCITDAPRQNLRPVIVRTGLIRLSEGPRKASDFSVEKIVLHPRHQSEFRYHDLALLRTDRPVAFSASEMPVCLATAATPIDVRTPLVFAGWGATDLAGFGTNADLNKIHLQLVELDECKKVIEKNMYIPHGVDSSMMCAAEPDRKASTCRGDSGGPLAVRGAGAGADLLVGVTSFGPRPCGGVRPTMFARVQPALPWIESVVWPPASTDTSKTRG